MACFASPHYSPYPHDSLDDAEKKTYASTMNAVVSVRDGAFGQHTGFAPVFKSGESLNLEGSRESNVEYQGKGEIGAIMLDFQWNAMMQTKGYGELAKPMYDQRMWDDRGCALKAPTVRVVTDIAMAIVANVSGQQYLQYLDDLLFAGADLAGGYKTPEEVGKKLAIQAVSAGVGEAGKVLSSVTGKIADAGLQTLCNVGLAGAQAATNATAGAFINNVNFSKLGTSDWFNGAGFANTMTSADTWAGTVSAMAGAGVTGGLGLLDLYDGNQTALSGNVFNLGGICTLNSLAGGLASTGVTYAMTGNASINLANFAGVGLFEVSFGKDGFSMGLGMGGADMSLGKIAGAMQGLSDASKIIGAKADYAFGNDQSLSVLNAVNGMGWSGNEYATDIANRIWDGKLKTNFGDTDGAYGFYNGTAAPDTITLSNDLRGMGKEKAAKLAAVMAHEGSHADGNRYENVAHAVGLQTYDAINAAFNLSGDESFADEMLQGINDPMNQIENTGDVDFWRMNVIKDKDGNVTGHTMTWDGQDDFDLSAAGIADSVSFEDMLANPEKYEKLLAGKKMTVTGKDLTKEQLMAMATVSEKKAGLQDHLKAYSDATQNKKAFAYDSSLLSAFQESLLTLQGMGCISGAGGSLVSTALQKGSLNGKDFYAPSTVNSVNTLFGKRFYVGELGDDKKKGTLREPIHTGIDQPGVENYYSSTGGVMTLDHKKEYGLFSEIKDKDKNFEQKTAHNGSETIDAYMNLWGQKATGLSLNGSTYSLSGIEAGSKIGSYAYTGLTTGNHLHVEYTNKGKKVNPLKVYDDAGIGYNVLPSAYVDSGYDVGVILNSLDFAKKFFSQKYKNLPGSLQKDMMSVLDANKLWESEGLYSLPTETVTSYFKNWWSSANAIQKQYMLEYAEKKQIKGYETWKHLPSGAQQTYSFW